MAPLCNAAQQASRADVARIYRAQQRRELLTAIADARTSHSSIDRRYALRLIRQEKRRIEAERMQLRAAAGLLPTILCAA